MCACLVALQYYKYSDDEQQAEKVCLARFWDAVKAVRACGGNEWLTRTFIFAPTMNEAWEQFQQLTSCRVAW